MAQIPIPLSPHQLVEFARHKLEYGKALGQLAIKTGAVTAMRPKGLWALLGAALRRSRDPNFFIHVNARNAPDRPAVVDGRRRLTFGELDQRIRCLAAAFEDAGVKSGDRVAFMLHNCSEYVETSAAVTRLGATVVPIGYRLRPPEVAYILENSGARALVFDTRLAEVIDAARAEARHALVPDGLIAISRAGERTPAFAREFEPVIERNRARRRQVDGLRGQAGVMVYTSGTTGRPKGAMRSMAESGWEPIVHLMLALGMNRDDRHLVACPLYHSLGGFFTAFNLILGAAVVIMDKFDAEKAQRLLHDERITTTAMVPTMLRRLAELPDELRRRYPAGDLRVIVSSAAPLPPDVSQRILDLYGPVLWDTYGASEIGLCTLASPDDLRRYPGTVGRILPGNVIRLLDEEGREVPEGGVGEIYVGNETTIDGYHENREATEKARRGELFSVGDMARRNPQGYYFLVDRKTDMVISGGVNIYPAEIEQELHRHPGVAEVAVVGVPDPEWGESLVAFIVPRAHQRPTVDGLTAFCRERLAGYKVPRRFEFLDELPRNPSGKVLKRELRERASGA